MRLDGSEALEVGMQALGLDEDRVLAERDEGVGERRAGVLETVIAKLVDTKAESEAYLARS